MSLSAPTPAMPALPPVVAPPPAFGMAPVGQKPSKKSSQPTFLGSGTMANFGGVGQASGDFGGKTLLGT